MSIVDKVESQEERLAQLEEALNTRKKEKEKKLTIKIPFNLRKAATKDGNISVCLWLGHNHRAEFKKAVYRDGLIYVGAQSYAYEEGSVYQLKHGNKTLPFCVVFEWRLLPVGGMAESHRTLVLDGKDAEAQAEALGITNYAQLTMVRRLEQSEVDKDTKQKKGMGVIVWVLVAGVAIYLVSKFFGGA